jgi:hypothetical protein
LKWPNNTQIAAAAAPHFHLLSRHACMLLHNDIPMLLKPRVPPHPFIPSFSHSTHLLDTHNNQSHAQKVLQRELEGTWYQEYDGHNHEDCCRKQSARATGKPTEDCGAMRLQSQTVTQAFILRRSISSTSHPPSTKKCSDAAVILRFVFVASHSSRTPQLQKLVPAETRQRKLELNNMSLPCV